MILIDGKEPNTTQYSITGSKPNASLDVGQGDKRRIEGREGKKGGRNREIEWEEN